MEKGISVIGLGKLGAQLESLYRSVCENRPSFARMNFVNPEIAKLAVNTYVTTKVSFANMLARLCEKVPGASVEAITGAIVLDSRIGGKYLKGAISYGGPYFPRDNLAMIAFADRRARNGLPRVVIDCWRALGHLESASGVLYLALGNGVTREESKAEGAAQ